MANNGKPFLFYSNMCHHSKRLISRIQTTNLVNNLNFICVDNPQLNIPSFITSVPTLYDPNMGRPITDSELFNWIESVLGGRGNQPSPQQPQFNQGGMGGMQPQYPNQGGMGGGMQPQYPNQGGMNPGSGMGDQKKRMEEMLKSDQGMISMGNGNVDMADITGDSSITAFQPSEMLAGGAGTGYSFIEDGANDTLAGNFIRLDKNGNEDSFRNENSHMMASITKANNAVPEQGGGGNGQQSATNSAYDKLLAERHSEMQNSMCAMRM